MTDHEPEYELVIPFVVCQSQGGPHDDDSFVAGYEMGRLDMLLSQKPDRLLTEIHTTNTAQADLVAMHHRYTMKHKESFVDGWTDVEFRRMGADEQ